MLLCWGEFAMCHRGCTSTHRKENQELQLQLSSCLVLPPLISLAFEEFPLASTQDPIFYTGSTLPSARWPLVTKQLRATLNTGAGMSCDHRAASQSPAQQTA